MGVYYKVGSNESGWTDVFSFGTRPFSPTATTRVSVFGDLGFENSTYRRETGVTAEVGSDTSRRQLKLTTHWSATWTRDSIVSLKNRGAIDAVIHLGDIGYADDAFLINPLYMTYEKTYNGYMNWFQDFATNLPYMVTPGNHESECHSPACVINHKKYGLPLSNFSAFNHRWSMPSVESGGHRHSNMWYSFNFGAVHYVSLNTETDFPGAGEEHTGDSGFKNLPAGGFGYKGEYLQWLENDLKQAQAARQSRAPNARPWIVAIGHRPYKDIATSSGPLLEKYGVDIYFAGHAHSYSRSWPASTSGAVETDHDKHLYKSPNGTVWVVAGGAGCDEMPEGSSAPHDDYLLDGDVSPEGSNVVKSNRYASGVLTANATALSWQLIDSVDGTDIDHFTILK